MSWTRRTVGSARGRRHGAGAAVRRPSLASAPGYLVSHGCRATGIRVVNRIEAIDHAVSLAARVPTQGRFINLSVRPCLEVRGQSHYG
ncbi:unnamed protein product (plasmid) [Mycetohabitans rhizoxinica HKI 454]|uniref:Uncharacterized protein n=1 Tax=Mycetohabitans rhizoxinica (strain DSM 19002 / CIP 109453 / HKI 454) TaxID=882378 RepID=E5AVC3_MYCRK|nr:unnamed protein product [Mycetohabitans rhizoxinica HKI 454]